VDAPRVDPLRQVHHRERRLVVRRRPLGDLQLRPAALLRLQQPGSDQHDPLPQTAALSRRLPQLLLLPDGGVLGGAVHPQAQLRRDQPPPTRLEAERELERCLLQTGRKPQARPRVQVQSRLRLAHRLSRRPGQRAGHVGAQAAHREPEQSDLEVLQPREQDAKHESEQRALAQQEESQEEGGLARQGGPPQEHGRQLERRQLRDQDFTLRDLSTRWKCFLVFL
jgi:hypothetical protein